MKKKTEFSGDIERMSALCATMILLAAAPSGSAAAAASAADPLVARLGVDKGICVIAGDKAAANAV